MPRKQKLDKTIQEYMVVEDPAAIKLLFTPKYAEVIRLIENEEMSLSDIARALNVNPGSVHYHLKELEKHGLVKQVREEIKGGIVKKYYRKAARHISIDASGPKSAPAASEVGLDEAYKEKLLKSLGFFGYEIVPEKFESAKAQMMKCDERVKTILKELQQAGFERVESDRVLVANAYQFALLVRLMEDEEYSSAMKKLIGSFSSEKNTR